MIAKKAMEKVAEKRWKRKSCTKPEAKVCMKGRFFAYTVNR